MNTPWGPSQRIWTNPNGILSVSTASHGGFYVPENLRHKLLPFDANALESDGWYEEDCECLKVYLAFPELIHPSVGIEKIRKGYDFWFNPDGTYRSR